MILFSMPRDSVVIRLRTQFFFIRRILCYFFLCHGTFVVIRLRTRTFIFMRRRSFGRTEPKKKKQDGELPIEDVNREL